jgi:hypothetical protein
MEELYILENQAEWIESQPSDEFMEAATEQRRRIHAPDQPKGETK